MASDKGGIMSKEAANLDPPKDDPISVQELAKSDGACSSVLFNSARLSVTSQTTSNYVQSSKPTIQASIN